MNELKHLKQMYTIYKRNWQTLREREAYYAEERLAFPVHFQHQLEDNWDNMIDYQNKLKDYLGYLKLEEAKKGINTPPEILMDIKEIEGLLK